MLLSFSLDYVNRTDRDTEFIKHLSISYFTIMKFNHNSPNFGEIFSTFAIENLRECLYAKIF